jgi:hypothetical protein
MRSDEFWDGAFVDMGIERGVWYAALVTASSRTTRVHDSFFHHHLYKFSISIIKVKFVINFRLVFVCNCVTFSGDFTSCSNIRKLSFLKQHMFVLPLILK